MIDTTTIKPIQTERTNQTQNDRSKGLQSFRPQQFQNSSSKNPCHDGCNVTEKQLQTSRGETQAVSEISNSAEQSAGVDKVSGGHCPGSNVIENILQALIQALEATRVGR